MDQCSRWSVRWMVQGWYARQFIFSCWGCPLLLQHWFFCGPTGHPLQWILISSDTLFVSQCAVLLPGLCHFSCWFRISKSEIRVYLAFKLLHQNIYLSVIFRKYLLSACVENSTEGSKGIYSSWGCFLIGSSVGNTVRLARMPRIISQFLEAPRCTLFFGVFWPLLECTDSQGQGGDMFLYVSNLLSFTTFSFSPTYLYFLSHFQNLLLYFLFTLYIS